MTSWCDRNTIRRAGIWKQPALDIAGALSVGAYERGRYVPLPGGHRNIPIEDNRFEDVDNVNVLISSPVGVTLRGDEFIHAMKSPSDRGKSRGVGSDALLWLTECQDVQLKNNRVTEPGSFLKKRASPTDTASGIGLADGVGGK